MVLAGLLLHYVIYTSPGNFKKLCQTTESTVKKKHLESVRDHVAQFFGHAQVGQQHRGSLQLLRQQTDKEIMFVSSRPETKMTKQHCNVPSQTQNVRTNAAQVAESRAE